MSDTVLAIWVIVVWIFVLNCCAAGVGAMLHIWRRKIRRGGRIVAAAAIAGLLNIGMFVPVAFTDPTWAGPDGPLFLGVVFLGVLVLTFVIALPGAMVVARKLEAPGDDYRAFE
jgi:hypothetical protein